MKKSRRQERPNQGPERAGNFEVELRRQLFHAVAGILLAYFMLTMQRAAVISMLGTATLVLICLAIYRGHRARLHKHIGIEQLYLMEEWFERRMLEFERPREFPLRGALFFLVGSFIVFELFPLRAAVGGVLVLAVADAASTLVGKMWGRHKLPFNRNKSWEGSSAFFIGSMLSLLGFMHPLNAAIISLVAMLVEMAPEVDDNVTVPLAVALLIKALNLA